jgi:hypothetical protein
MVDVIAKYGEVETALKLNQIETFDYRQMLDEDREKADAKETSLANDFLNAIMGNQQQGPEMGQQEPQMAQMG